MYQTQFGTEPLAAPATAAWIDGIAYAAIFASAILLWWITNNHAALVPFWGPWEFSFVEFLSAWLAAFWYLRGLSLTPAAEQPSILRRIAFFAGLIAIYAVLETRFEYLAEHQFFYNRIQHVVMHHIGPFLLALSWPSGTLLRGMPALARRVIKHRFLVAIVHILQQPVLAAFLFSGTFFLWLVPAIHFHAMLDSRLFALMNWTMVGEGILFWCLVLDPRPSPPARASFGARVALAVVVMFPQILGGSIIALTQRDLYPYYDLCGRIYPELGPLYDQSLGGVIIWIPPAMMSVLAMLLVLNLMRKAEERTPHAEPVAGEGQPTIDTSLWTGR